VTDPFEAEAARHRRGDPGVVATWRAGTGKRGGPRARRGTARRRVNGPAVVHAAGAAWPRRAAGRTGEGWRD
jgi:hypothetical protein